MRPLGASPGTRGTAPDEDIDLGSLQQRLFQVAYMMLGERAASEDVAQEAVARVVEHRNSFRGEGGFSGWAFTIAVNLCRARRKAEGKGPLAVDQGILERTSLASPRPGPATSVILHESYERAAVAVRALSPILREVFILHYVEGLPYSDVAFIIGTSEGAARLRARRARESLRESLSAFLTPEMHRSIDAESTPRRAPEDSNFHETKSPHRDR